MRRPRTSTGAAFRRTALGVFTLAEMELELSDLLGRKVDLREPEEIGKYFRDKVLASAVVQ